jgi:hypothetical protein
MSSKRKFAPMMGLAAIIVLVAAAPAGAQSYAVSGKQVAVNEKAGKFKMKGGLLGKWRITSFKQTDADPVFRAKGTEEFSGCLDLGRDGSCSGDPTGNLSFRFRYSAKFGPDGGLIWGKCWHPITGGTDGFAGATGAIRMTDRPTAKGVKTTYEGDVTLGAQAAGYRAAPTAGCGTG